MRFFLTTVGPILLTILLSASSALAQQWTIPLRDITEDDPELDGIRAEAMEFLPDGKTVATAGWFYDSQTKTAVGEVRLRDVNDGSLKIALQGSADVYSNRAGSLAVSPDGKRIAAIGSAGRGDNRRSVMDLFDVGKGKLLHTIDQRAPRFTWVTFSPDGKTLATAHHTGEIVFWNPKTGEKITSFNQLGAGPIAFSPDGRTLAAANSAGVFFHDVKNAKEIGKIDLDRDFWLIGSLAFSPDGKLLALGGFPQQGVPSPIVVCECRITDSGNVQAKVKQTFKGHKEYTYSVAFSPDSKLLASASQDNTARIWDLRTNKEFKTISAHDDFVYDVAFSLDGKVLATLGRDSLKLWKIKQLQKEK